MARKKKRTQFLRPVKELDVHKKVQDDFLTKYKFKKMWMIINESILLKVKVVGGGNPRSYENILVRVIYLPKTSIKKAFGNVRMKDKTENTEWKKIKVKDEIYVNHLSLYTSEHAYKKIKKNKEDNLEKIMLLEYQKKFIDKNQIILEESESKISKEFEE